MSSSFHPHVWEVLGKRVPTPLDANCRDEGDFLIVRNICFTSAGIIALNKTAKTIYKLCDGEKNTAEIIDAMKQDYPDIPEEKLTIDVHLAIRDLEIKRLVTVVSKKYLDGDPSCLNHSCV